VGTEANQMTSSRIVSRPGDVRYVSAPSLLFAQAEGFVMDLNETEWYFPGNGFIYVRSPQWHLCGPMTIRKFRWTGNATEEVPQPLLWIDQTDAGRDWPVSGRLTA
jgi:hypothetical protein